ncbi:hypothetical protein EJB05_40988 [Eragrostis curvula]|uniref:Bifunctional inhibitor/plant lipid transfer protein/seed storage helical domain-containing protein n=1 Tax=Eragrostis curvula TaxID=38414 RepID=A0A5J9T8K4_9POAL|nr:hypothetical protein EJB05_40988 [Eragrostis curvula]
MRSLLLQVAVAALAVSIAAAALPTSDDGTAVPSCAAKLVPCGAYLNSTAAPPATCCGPLKDAAFNETACMCSMLLNKAALQAFGVEPEKGMALAKRCGVNVDASVCSKYTDAGAGTGAGSATGGATAGSSSSTGGSASTATKPAANGGTKHRLSLMSALSLVGFSFIWWMIMA